MRSTIERARTGAVSARWRLAALVAIVVSTLLSAAPARADDIGAAGRGVVRIVTIAVVNDEVVGFGHGSGVVVAPNRVLTNGHVVELAARYPDNVVIGVVPGEGDKSFQGRLIAHDAKRDLALIEYTGTALPRATFYTGPVADGAAVVALGYPGNVDLATAQSAADYIRPTSAVRTEGVFSGRRALGGTAVLLHTASIARGNSGGPLLDRCGRVLGINSAITRGQEGDANFGFAIANTEVAAFLAAAGQPYAAVAIPCSSIEERVRADGDAEARALTESAAARRDAATRASIAREEALANARASATRARENVMALAALLLVGGAFAGGIGGLFLTQHRTREGRVAAGAGALLVVAAIATFVLRPSDRLVMPASRSAVAPALVAVASGPLRCAFVPERSRATVSAGSDVALDWGRDGCADRRTQFVPDGARWAAVLSMPEEQAVTVRMFDPATRTLVDNRYLLATGEMAAAERAPAPAQCGAADREAARQATIRATLPPLPNERLVYTCRAVR